MKICPGRYRLRDPTEKGVIIIAASRSRLDLSGVILESGDSVPGRFVGVGVVSRGVDRVEIVVGLFGAIAMGSGWKEAGATG